MNALTLYAGPRALLHIQQHGLHAADVDAVPGAAGGPKGLILQGLDHFLFGQWFNAQAAQRRADKGLEALQLIGASIGAWRMAAACAQDPIAAFQRLAHQYCEAQRYPKGVKRPAITQVCHGMVNALVDHEREAMSQPQHKQLLVWVNRGKKNLYAQQHEPRKGGFASAVLSNAWNRNNLAKYFERWVFHSGSAAPKWLQTPYDALNGHFEELSALNLPQALLASGSIPFVLDAVPHIHQARSHNTLEGPFWDGGLTDYHLALPYHRLPGLVVYPHFAHHITPGWLDKFIRLRKADPEWLSNVLLVCPSTEFVKSLPARKIPDRSDFKRYGLNHDLRIQHWKQAIAESHRLADEFARFIEQPNIKTIRPIG